MGRHSISDTVVTLDVTEVEHLSPICIFSLKGLFFLTVLIVAPLILTAFCAPLCCTFPSTRRFPALLAPSYPLCHIIFLHRTLMVAISLVLVTLKT